jgi:dCMP deaminase
MKQHWYHRFLDMAKHVSKWSKDPSTKCGAIIVDKYGTVISTGYNGFPRGVEDSENRYLDREYKYDHVVHAEINAIIQARTSISGYTVFVWPMLPCIRCATVLVQSDIKEVVSVKLRADLVDRWGASIDKSKNLFREVGVIITEL